MAAYAQPDKERAVREKEVQDLKREIKMLQAIHQKKDQEIQSLNIKLRSSDEKNWSLSEELEKNVAELLKSRAEENNLKKHYFPESGRFIKETVLLAKIVGIETTGESLDLINKITAKIKEIINLDRILNQRKDFVTTQKTKIANGKTGEVIRNMIKFAKSEKEKSLEVKFINISSRFKIVSNEKSQNIINSSDASLEITKINNTIINILSELEEEV